MADGLCGPSNALKSFSGHVEQDRSLQQDRSGLASQPQPEQFRTSDRNAAQSHDANFLIALDGSPAPLADFPRPMPEMIQHHQSTMFTQLNGPSMVTPQSASTPALDWASQFQQMSLNNQHHAQAPAATTPHQQQSFQAQPVQQHQMPQFGATYHEPQLWHPVPQHTAIGMPRHYSASPSLFQSTTIAPSQTSTAPLSQTTTADAEFDESMDQWMAEHGPRAEAVIDAEMESLARELEEQEAIAKDALPENLAVQEPLERAREPESEVLSDEKKAGENADELAAAARRIVDVMDTTHASNKMKNSGFLSLMRRLADGDVTLKDQDFVDDKGTKVNVSDDRAVNNSENNQTVNLTIPKGAKMDAHFTFWVDNDNDANLDTGGSNETCCFYD